MIKNYLKIALRSLWKQKIYTTINFIGLTTGITSCLLILLFVQNELSFDKFHDKSDHIYRAWVLEDYNNGVQFFNTVTPYPLAPALKSEIPEVQEAIQISVLNRKIKIRDKIFNGSVHMVSPEFLGVFSFKTIHGNSTSALKDASSVILTQKEAIKLFGKENAVGETLTLGQDNKESLYNVAAILEDPPSNSSIQFKILISDVQKSNFIGPFSANNWFSINPETYVLLEPSSIPEDIDDKLKKIVERNVRIPDGSYTIGLQPITDIHLNTDFPKGIASISDPKYSYILGSVAGLILLIACVNFILLTLSRSISRAKEIGIRKSVGALKGQVIKQFISETTLFVVICLVFGLGMTATLLPSFNDLADRQLEISFNLFMILATIGIILIVGVLAGFYPSYVVSRFNAVDILKGGGNSGRFGKNSLRRVLVGIQFVLSIGLIAGTLIMREQLNYLRNKNLGFDKEQLINVPLNLAEGMPNDMVKKGFDMKQAFKNKLVNRPEILSIASASHAFASEGWTEVKYTDLEEINRTFNLNSVSYDYIPTLGMEIVEGRNFDKNNTSDTRRAVIVNEAFVKAYGIEQLTGEGIPNAIFADHEIIGVVKDFNYQSLHGEIAPMLLTMNPMLFFGEGVDINFFSDPNPKLFIRLAAGRIPEGLEQIENTWTEVMNAGTFEFKFVDQQIDNIYNKEQSLGKIIGIAALLAIFVGGLGLFALSALSIQNRLKEISVRKILGASSKSILFILSKEYVFMILITLLIATPIGWYVMEKWLSGFAYRIDISLLFFGMAGSIALITAFISIGYHAINATKTQPVDHLRNE